MNVAIYSRGIKKKDIAFFLLFLQKLKDLKWTPIFENRFYQQLKLEFDVFKNHQTFNSYKDFLTGIDLAISIGGDGTYIQTVGYVRSSGVPIIGINTGRLGFLADTNTDAFEKTLDKIQKKEYTIQKRSLICVETEHDILGENNLAFNEVAIHKKDTTSMITVDAYLAGKYVNSYWADGLLIGTPTGSTAYNLSCGGPIIYPEAGVHFLTPIAAHNLNVRPLIVPDHIEITVKTKGRHKDFLLSLDSHSKTVATGTEIILRKSDFTVNLIKFEENDFFTVIRNKLFWGTDQRNE